VVLSALAIAVGVRRVTRLVEQRVANRTRELAALNAIAATVGQSPNLDESLDDALGKVLQVMDIEAGGVYLLDEESGLLTIATQRGFSPQFVSEIDRLKVGEGFSGRVVESGQPLVVRNVSTDPRLTRAAVQEEGLRSVAIVPLSSRRRVLGTLFAATRGYREFTEQEVQSLSSIGHQIGVAIENARLLESEQRRAEQFRVIGEVGRHIASILDVDELLGEIVRLLKETFGYYMITIGLIEGNEVVFKAGVKTHWAEPQFRPPPLKVGDQGITSWVAATGESLLVPDVSKEPRYRFLADAAETRSELAVPLKTKSGIIGVLRPVERFR
jgi:GAF domain-containing protein